MNARSANDEGLPTLSVVIRSRDEADRLRLTLASLVCQQPFEVVVVDDSSSDHTGAVVEEARESLRVTYARNAECIGRSATSNAGAKLARGEVILFLDGDTLASPDCLALHARAHAAQPHLVGRGETLHLRCTRFLLDPETASPRAGEEQRLGNMRAAEREGLKVTRSQVLENFDSIHARAGHGIYPGAGPRRLYEAEVQALREHPQCSLLWAASAGSNLSVRRQAFLAAGGFDEALAMNEHRELALRLSQRGDSMGFVAGARTYHMTHRSGWRDPLADMDWERLFYERHPLPAVKLLSVFWAGLADASRIPIASRIESLPQLEARCRELSEAQIDSLRAAAGGMPALSRAIAGGGE